MNASETFLGKECDLDLTKEDYQFVTKQHNNIQANNVLSNSTILYRIKLLFSLVSQQPTLRQQNLLMIGLGALIINRAMLNSWNTESFFLFVFVKGTHSFNIHFIRGGGRGRGKGEGGREEGVGRGRREEER